jgi:hypothetical protein
MSGAENAVKPASAPMPATNKPVEPTPHAPIYPSTVETRRAPVEYVFPPSRVITEDVPIRYADARYAPGYVPRYYDSGIPMYDGYRPVSVTRASSYPCDKILPAYPERIIATDYPCYGAPRLVSSVPTVTYPSTYANRVLVPDLEPRIVTSVTRGYRPVSVTRILPTVPEKIVATDVPRYYGSRYPDVHAPRFLADDYRYPLVSTVAPTVIPATVSPVVDIAPARIINDRYYNYPMRHVVRRPSLLTDSILDDRYYGSRYYRDRLCSPYETRLIDESVLGGRRILRTY